MTTPNGDTAKCPIGSYKSVQRAAALPGVEILRGRIAGDARGGGFFTQYGIAAGKGPMRCYYRGEKYEVAGQYVVLVEAGDFVPVSAYGGGVEFQAWYFAPDVMRWAAEEHGIRGPPRFLKGLVQDARLHTLVMHTATALGGGADALEQQHAQAVLLDGVFGACVVAGRSIGHVIAHRAVRRMRDLIHDRYDQELSLEMLAAHSQLNKFYALRAFKRAMGVAPHEYQRRIRVGVAQQMLRSGRSATEIAHDLSFYDQSHFTRTFRQITCMTPRQYQIGIRATRSVSVN